MTDPDVDAMAALYAQGRSTGIIGYLFDLRADTVTRRLRAAGVVLRGPDGRAP